MDSPMRMGKLRTFELVRMEQGLASYKAHWRLKKAHGLVIFANRPSMPSGLEMILLYVLKLSNSMCLFFPYGALLFHLVQELNFFSC